MIDIIYKLIDLMTMYINAIFNLKIDFVNGEKVSLGIVVIAFIFIVLAIYLTLKGFGIIKDGGDSDE